MAKLFCTESDRDQETCVERTTADPMSITRAPFLTLGLCLGGILCILPRSIATGKSSYSFPDGSTCYVCDAGGSDWSGLYECFLYDYESPGSTFYCSSSSACDGEYYPPGYEASASALSRTITSVDKCLYTAYDYTLDLSSPDYFSQFKVENCCFKPGSQVCISNFRVHYTGLMLGPELM